MSTGEEKRSEENIPLVNGHRQKPENETPPRPKGNERHVVDCPAPAVKMQCIYPLFRMGRTVHNGRHDLPRESSVLRCKGGHVRRHRGHGKQE